MVDKYIIPETAKSENPVLKNKLGITDYNELRKAEADITMATIIDVGTTFKQEFDENYLKSVHKHIFKDIYDWAGEYRTLPIYKTELVIPGISLEYSPVKEISPRLRNILAEMNSTDWDSFDINKKAEVFTSQIVKLWRVHPFRDGNTRTTLAFARQFANEHDFPLDLSVLLPILERNFEGGKLKRPSIRDLFVLATADEYPIPDYLQRYMLISMQKGIDEKIKKLNRNKLESPKAPDELDIEI